MKRASMPAEERKTKYVSKGERVQEKKEVKPQSKPEKKEGSQRVNVALKNEEIKQASIPQSTFDTKNLVNVSATNSQNSTLPVPAFSSQTVNNKGVSDPNGYAYSQISLLPCNPLANPSGAGLAINYQYYVP
jgi:hypothetical protein